MMEQCIYFLSLGSTGTFHGFYVEVCLFVGDDVPTILFAEQVCIAKCIEIVILELERKAHVYTKGIKLIGIVAQRASRKRPDLKAACQQYGRFQCYHVHVFIYGNIIAALK